MSTHSLLNHSRLHKLITQKKVLIAAHRGTCGGSIVQNTILAYENAIAHGADIIEVDVIQSSDGTYYAFHNGQERLVLGIDRDIRQMTSKEIEEIKIINSIDHRLQQRICRLEEILEHFRGRVMINIDRSWDYWEELLPLLASKEMDEQLILKAKPHKNYLSQLTAFAPNIPFMPICIDPNDLIAAEEFPVNLAAVEPIFENESSPLLAPDFIRYCKGQGYALWANAITLGDHVTLTAGHDDNNAILHGPDAHWGWLVDKGFDLIQTDWPALLARHLEGTVRKTMMKENYDENEK